MKSKLETLLIVCGSFLLFCGLLLSLSLVDYFESREVSGGNKFTVAAKQPFEKGDCGWNDWKRFFRNLDLVESYTASILRELKTPGATVKVRICGVNYKYPDFQPLTLAKGSFFNQEMTENGQPVIVIESALAEKLFSSRDVLGLTITLLGRSFKIVGITMPEPSFIGWTTGDCRDSPGREYHIYLPAGVLQKYVENSDIDYVQISTCAGSGNRSGKNGPIKLQELREALSKVGKEPSAYLITDYRQQLAWLRQKADLLLLLIGLPVILILANFLRKHLLKLVMVLKTDLCDHYFSTAIKKNHRRIGWLILETVIVIGMGFFILKAISFTPVIPEDWSPDKLFDWPYYGQLLQEAVRQSLIDAGRAFYPEELTLSAVTFYSNWLFVLGILGWFFVYLGWAVKRKLWKVRGIIPDRTGLMVKGSCLLIAIMLSLAVITGLAKLSWQPELSTLVLAWTFLAANIMHFSET